MSNAATKTVIDTPLLDVHRKAGAAIATWFGCALPDDFGDWLAEYRAARESVALIDKNYRAYLGFTGPDRVRYLNAILTNNIKDLAPGNGIVSLFLNPQGRIQAEIETYAMPDRLFCVSYAMIRDTLVPALDKFIIMDDVTLTDQTELVGTLALEGPKAAAVVKNLTAIDLAELQELSFVEASVAGISCRVTKRSFATGARYSVVCVRLRRQANSARSGPGTFAYQLHERLLHRAGNCRARALARTGEPSASAGEVCFERATCGGYCIAG